MESPCLSCTTKKFCRGSRDVLKKCPPGQSPVPGPCEPFNAYVMFLRQKGKTDAAPVEAKKDGTS